MALRTTETTVTFKHPFALASIDCPLPADAYRLVIDEEEILGLSFLAFQRVGTTLHTPALTISGRPHEAFLINAAELAAALQADGRPRTESHLDPSTVGHLRCNPAVDVGAAFEQTVVLFSEPGNGGVSIAAVASIISVAPPVSIRRPQEPSSCESDRARVCDAPRFL